MTNLKKLLLASAAITMMSGAAYAGGNEAVSNQTGDDNVTTITQTSTSNGHQANSDVTGNRNNVLILQDSNTSSFGLANVTINGENGDGDGNKVDVSQTSFQPFAANDQQADIDITGDANVVTTRQQYGTSFEANKLTIAIEGNGEGNDNTVDVNQFGNGANAGVTIFGDRNNVDIAQGTGSQRANVYIDGNVGDDEGDANKVNIVQNFAGSFEGTLGGNVANVDIYGDSNDGDIQQTGRGNSVDMNVGSSSFDSNSNMFSVSQSGDANNVVGNIFGNDNDLLVSQTGTGNSSTSGQFGNGNFVMVAQTGTGNMSNVTQVGNSNITNVSQGN